MNRTIMNIIKTLVCLGVTTSLMRVQSFTPIQPTSTSTATTAMSVPSWRRSPTTTWGRGTAGRTTIGSQVRTIVISSLSSSSSSSSSSPEATSTSSSNNVSGDNDSSDDDAEEGDDDVSLDKVERLGRGAAKAKRGKRKGLGADSSSSAAPAKTVLEPEQVFYEGPPAITETIVPTLSILTVVGIVPAAAAWARQAWVRYKITNRRIRVQSGLGGKDMAEIVYPDIVELRTARRLAGEGDLVAFLRDGARFEMRSIPNFLNTMDFILQHVDPDVAKKYRNKGDVTNSNN